MHDTTALVEKRIRRFVDERVRAAVEAASVDVEISAWEVPGEPVPFDHAREASYRPFAVGDAWGRPWGTTWFRLSGTVPVVPSGQRAEIEVDLGFSEAAPGFQAEGLVFRPDGSIIKAIEPRNRAIPLSLTEGERFEFFLEAAANPDIAGDWSFRATPLGDRETAGAAPLYRLRRAAVVSRVVEVEELLADIDVLWGLVRVLPADSTRRAEVLRALEDMADACDPDDIAGTAARGRQALASVLASPAVASAHHAVAVGHAHIDSAWLWPVRETQRKVARTFANVLALAEEHPGFVFAASSAQQYDWIRRFQPALFERVADAVARGAIVPVGGMWVEADTNLPGGEALARQFVRGTRFFREHFGFTPAEVWLPDSFGYSAALPGIARAAGARWMLTQKLSWNETNRMPHHTFLWEGHDGTRIFTHFPPVDTYGAELTAEELSGAERRFAEKGRARTSLVPYGYGDGGGGPTREMLAAATRLRSLEGLPEVELGGPREFFERAEKEYADPPVWSGELYLEFHRGTYTSQARMKRGNRRAEHALREAELWSSHAALLSGAEYPYDDLDALWEIVLLQQFHDILPGTSIAWVHREAERRYDEVLASAERIIGRALAVVTGDGTQALVANAGPFAQGGVAGLGIAIEPGASAAPATAVRTAEGFRLENDHLVVDIDGRGLVSSLVVRASGRDAIARGTGGNLLQLHRDTPAQWDAWDIDGDYRRHVEDLTSALSVEIVSAGDPASVCVIREWGGSRITQTLSLSSSGRALDIETTVDWHERQKLLKLAFPLAVHADRATSEIQFGHVHRPIHANTSWDMARFETPAQRWVHVAEPGFGVAIANDATYGHDITAEPGEDGRRTTVRLSLLRAPLYPDPDADQGEHVFRISIRPDAGIPEAIDEGYRLNLPARRFHGAAPSVRLLAIDNRAVVIEAVKLAEDRSGDLIVRLYEAHGGRARATLSAAFRFERVFEADLHEDEIARDALVEADGLHVTLQLRAFQLVTLRMCAPRAR